METSIPRSRPFDLVLIAATLIFSGAVIGASTNAVNGAVSPLYFRMIMRWHNVEDIWRASIAQGILEGLIYGVCFAVVFTLVVGIVSQSRCRFGFAFRRIIPVIIAIYCCWTIGGILGMFLACLSPEFYQNSFYGVPHEFVPMLQYAWVGGSIWGELFGSMLALTIGSIHFSICWKTSQAKIP